MVIGSLLTKSGAIMNDDKINVLFVCQDNSIRSVIAQALMKRFAGNRFEVFSCGLQPAERVHPRTVEMLTTQGLTMELKPRHVRDFLAASAPEMDFVINLCEEPLPRMPGNPFRAHWGITDPLRVNGMSEATAFRRTFRELENRVRLFAVLRHETRAERLAHREIHAEAA